MPVTKQSEDVARKGPRQEAPGKYVNKLGHANARKFRPEKIEKNYLCFLIRTRF